MEIPHWKPHCFFASLSHKVLHFGSDDGNIYAVDAETGRQIWKRATGGPVPATPAVANVMPFPVFGGVLAIFAHRHFGAIDAQRLLRGVLLASFSFAVFFLIVGTMLARYGCAATYLIAAAAALSVNAFLLVQLHRKT